MGILSILSLIWGILAIIGMAVAIIPFLGALNYLNIPFAVLGLLFSVLVLIVLSKKELAVAGCILCSEYSALIPLLQREVLCVDTTASTRSTLR